MRTTHKNVATLALLITSAYTMAQMSFSGEITPRTELRNGFKRPILESQDPALFTEQRTRLYVSYSQEKYDIHIAAQDVRIWGATAQIYKTDPALFNLYEGWARYKFSTNSSLKLGRMALDYDNARFLGNLDWAMQARSHDGALFETKNDSSKTSVHAGVYFNQDANTPEYAKLTGINYTNFDGNGNPLNYKAMMFIWFNKKLNKGSSFSLLAHNNVMNTPLGANLAMQTLGGVGFIKLSSNITLGTEAYYQTGIGTSQEVSALYFDIHTKLKYTKTTLAPGFEYLSGDNSNDGKNQSFNPLYGTNHKFNGYMDYFYVGNPHGNVGLMNPYLKTTTQLAERSMLEATIHGFWAAATINNKYLGTELDIIYINKLSDGVTLKFGHSFLSASNSMKALKGNQTNQQTINTWTWVQMVFKPKFI